jgi:hypothetical protein
MEYGVDTSVARVDEDDRASHDHPWSTQWRKYRDPAPRCQCRDPPQAMAVRSSRLETGDWLLIQNETRTLQRTAATLGKQMGPASRPRRRAVRCGP